MDMAPDRAEMRGTFSTATEVPAASRPSRRAFGTLHGATEAAMMMAMVWPVVACLPFFWVPPFWILAATAARPQPLD